MRREEYLTLTTLKERGWSPALINRLLGAPDKAGVNPHYRSGPPVQLYLQERVSAAESRPEFTGYQASRDKRATASRDAADLKRDELLKRIDQLEITVARRPLAEVMRESLLAWRDHQRLRRNNFNVDSVNAPQEVRERWAVNFVRHELTAYDAFLFTKIKRQIGAREAADRLKTRVLRKIAEVYPELAAAVQDRRLEP